MPNYDLINISIVMPCFNAGAYLRQAISSILSQEGNFKVKEIIIVDDNSTDADTKAVLAGLSGQERIHVLTNNGIKGAASARNTGIQAAQSDWIAFLDADDYFLPESLAVRCAAIRKFPGTEWVGGDFLTLNRDGTLESLGHFAKNLDNYYFLSPAFSEGGQSVKLVRPVREFLHQAPINTIVTLAKRSLLLRIGCFDNGLFRQQDYHLFLRLATNADFVFVPTPVAVCRLHDNNSTRSLTHTQKWRIDALSRLATLPEFLQYRSQISEKIFNLALSNSYESRREHRFVYGMTWAFKAMIHNPISSAAWRSLLASALGRD
jgi:glycosyltransferase involved in cell wall biosynthesis